MTRRYSAVVLAGGDGTRLRSLTRQLAGDDRPKQFCRTIVTRKHERFYQPELADAAPVRRFWEKPSAPLAERLAQAGCLWNSFVIVARPGTLGRLIRRAVPELVDAFRPLVSRLLTPWEEEAARAVYVGLPPIDFSKRVLQVTPADLAVLPVSGLEWNDLGDPVRVGAKLVRRRWQLASA